MSSRKREYSKGKKQEDKVSIMSKDTVVAKTKDNCSLISKPSSSKKPKDVLSLESKRLTSTELTASVKSEKSKAPSSVKSKDITSSGKKDKDIVQIVQNLKSNFNLEDGMKLLITNHIELNRKVGLFNADLSVLARTARAIDKAILDIENRLRSLEGRSDFSYKPLFENLLTSAELSDDLKSISDKILTLKSELEGLMEGGADVVLETEKVKVLLTALRESGISLPFDTEALISELLRSKKRHYGRRGSYGYSEGGSSTVFSAKGENRKGEREKVNRLLFDSEGIQRWDVDYAESMGGRKLKRIPGVSFDTYERSINQFSCRKCGGKIERSEELITDLIYAEINYFLGENNPEEEVNLYTCRVCGLPVTDEDFVREHVSVHIENNQVFYCLKCQQEINSIEDSYYESVDEERPDLITLHTILTLDERSYTKTRADIKFAPQCAKCGRVFSYLVPLVKKIVVRSYKAKPDKTDDTEKYFYLCLICGMKKSYKSHIELHALDHIENSELYCNKCSLIEDIDVIEETSQNDPTNDITLELLDKEKDNQ